MELAADEVVKLLEAVPDDVRYLGLLAEIYGEMGKEEEALELYRRIFSIDPENGLAQLSIAEFYKMTGDHEKRFEYLNMAFGNDELTIEKKLEVMIELLTSDREVASFSNEIERLINLLFNLYPDEYRIHAAYGDFLVKKERYKEAINEFEKVISQYKANYFIWEQLIFLYNAEGDNEKVYELSSEAITLFPERPVLYLLKGNIEADREDYEKGIRTLRTGEKYAENNGRLLLQFYSFIAEAYRQAGDDAQSDSYFEKALGLDPANLLILNNYSYYLALREVKLEEAEKMSRVTIGAEPGNPVYLDTYAWILYKQGKNKKALEYMADAVKNGGEEDPDIMEHYGDILNTLGEREEAVKYWKKAIELGAEEQAILEKINK
jgi:tetratricopeptide (TPR) repeat protein